MTSQVREILVIDGKLHELESLPLEPLLDALDRRPDLSSWCRTWSSCLRRGYVGYWRIIDGELFLTRLGTYDEDVDIDLRHLFPEREAPIFAWWYSGKLRVPMGDQLLYVHMGWQSWYERERIIHVRQGRVVKERNVDHPAVSRSGRPPPALDEPRRGHRASRPQHSKSRMADG